METPPPPVSIYHVTIPGDPTPVRVVLTANPTDGVVDASVAHPRYKGPAMLRRHTRSDVFVQVYGALVTAFGQFALQVTEDGTPSAAELLAKAETAVDPVFVRNTQELARRVIAFARAPSALYDAGKAWAKACVAFKPGECARHDTLLAAKETEAQELVALALQVYPEATQPAPRGGR